MIKGVVKQILSGDSVVLLGSTRTGSAAERTLTLSYVRAPRLARLPTEVDEPFAFASREMLRKTLLGKTVSFQIEAISDTSGREFGSIYLDGEDVRTKLVQEGLVRVNRESKQQDELMKFLCAVEDEAIAAKKGIWSSSEGAKKDAVRTVVHVEGEESRKVFKALEGKAVPGIVEYIQDGSSFRILLYPSQFLPNPSAFYLIKAHLCGIQAPIAKKDGEVQPFAREAKLFCEPRIFQRELGILIEGVDKYNNFFVTLKHPQGNISLELVKNGLAKIADWSIGFTPQAAELRKAEEVAKQKKINMWKDYVEPAKSTDGLASREIVALVSEVHSGDTIVIQDLNDASNTKRINLSSIRAPKLGNAKRKEKDAPYAWESREFLRTRLIGKQVNVHIDYIKKATPELAQLGDREHATVTIGPLNIAVELVKNGLASVFKHRADEERASNYEALMSAEAQAAKAAIGIHSKRDVPIRRYSDLTQDGTNSRQYLVHLQAKRESGIVEHVANGSRLRIFIPSQSCLIPMSLAGIRCPAVARTSTEASEEYGPEALLMTKSRCLHRDVEVEVSTIDKAGTFIGNVFINKKSLALMLLENGMAFTHEASVYQLPNARELLDTEAKAKARKAGMWATFVEQPKTVEVEPEAESDDPEYTNVFVTNVSSKFVLHIQLLGEGSPEDVEAKIRANSIPSDAAAAFTIRTGLVVCAQFSYDQQWYRGLVKSIPKPNHAEILYVDYGNSEVVPFARIKPLSPKCSTLPHQATEVSLAHIKAPKDEELNEEATKLVEELTYNKVLVACIEEKKADRSITVSLYDPETKASVSGELVRHGLAKVIESRNKRFENVIGQLRTNQDYAKSKRYGIWRYGDAPDSDEEEEVPVAKPKAKGGRF
eukprot:TRINITY_DN1181_c0_g1_i6.p1 TRINITY_DN1181_c0_g1~~TRINITY_DN1181_c0_g1_i6.p1  ORF type:complete len:883 (+),score=226.48 TRINITY_DN1181_c0_g1_i6:92-2740(+)